MSNVGTGTYNALSGVIILSAWLSLVIAIAYLVAAIVGWRGPHRRSRLLRCLVAFGAFPALIAAQYALLFYVFLPSLGRQRAAQMAARRQERGDAAAVVRRGDKAPSFRLRDVDGREFSTDELRGKVVLVNFFATWCGPCLLELPHVQQIWESHRERNDFKLLVIGREESDATIRDFRTAHKFSFPMAADPKRAVYGLFAKELIPRTYLIAKDGTIRFTATGFAEEDTAVLTAELMAALNEE